MYLIVIGWIYVVLMMAVAEASNTTGTVMGGIITFFLYGVGPAGLLAYLMGTPARNKAIKKRKALERAEYVAGLAAVPATGESTAPTSVLPDASGHAASGEETVTVEPGITPVRKEL